MILKRTLGPKGQIVLPKDVREHLGLKSGSAVIFEVRGQELIIRAGGDPEKFVEEFCSVPRKLRRRVDLRKMYEEQLEERYEVR